MAEFTLIIGNRAYSSWSLRGWLACRIAGIKFAETVKNMGDPDWKDWVTANSPSGKVPCLRHGQVTVWESLAIGEYLHELYPHAELWPASRPARAQARSMAAEMHSGFAELRKAMWMNTRARFPGKGRTPGALADIARIAAIWRAARGAHGKTGPFLFGRRLTFADAMFAPVVARFVTWAPELPADAKTYVEAVWEHPLLLEWRKAADAEPWTIPHYETPEG